MNLDEFHARFEIGRDGRAKPKVGGKLPTAKSCAPTAGSGATPEQRPSCPVGSGSNAVAEGGVTRPPKDGKARNKFRNVPALGPAPWGGMVRYASKAEAKVAERHDLEKRAGVIRAWAIQVSIPIGTGPRGLRRHVVDFLAQIADGSMRIIECKGFDHRAGAQKRRDLEAMGFMVEVRP